MPGGKNGADFFRRDRHGNVSAVCMDDHIDFSLIHGNGCAPHNVRCKAEILQRVFYRAGRLAGQREVIGCDTEIQRQRLH